MMICLWNKAWLERCCCSSIVLHAISLLMEETGSRQWISRFPAATTGPRDTHRHFQQLLGKWHLPLGVEIRRLGRRRRARLFPAKKFQAVAVPGGEGTSASLAAFLGIQGTWGIQLAHSVLTQCSSDPGAE